MKHTNGCRMGLDDPGAFEAMINGFLGAEAMFLKFGTPIFDIAK